MESKQPESFLLIYTGGGEAAFYRMVRSAIPQKPGPCGTPIVHNDGRIEYPTGEPPDIVGYERVRPREFKPIWPSCRWRTLTVTAPNGQIDMKPCCQYPLAKAYLKAMTPVECSECDQREAITRTV